MERSTRKTPVTCSSWETEQQTRSSVRQIMMTTNVNRKGPGKMLGPFSTLPWVDEYRTGSRSHRVVPGRNKTFSLHGSSRKPAYNNGGLNRQTRSLRLPVLYSST